MDNRNPAVATVIGNESVRAFIDKTSLAAQVEESKLQAPDPSVQEQNILRTYNQDSSVSWFTPSILRGERLKPGEFLLGYYNNKQPQLAPPDPDNNKIAEEIFLSPNKSTKAGPTVQSTDAFYGVCGRYVLNVPLDKYVLAMTGDAKPKIYGPGPHVINNANLQFAHNKISSENFNHILVTDMAKDMVDINASVISNHNIHIFRIPAGYYGAIYIGSNPVLLPARAEPYVFNDPLVKYDSKKFYFNMSDSYINHGTLHVLWVPQGKIATVWKDKKPYLLEHRDEPYVFETQNFTLERKDEANLFYDSTDKKIILGQIKRIIPTTGEVAVTYNEGTVQILQPRAQGSNKEGVYTINKATHMFEDFLNINTSTAIFPSEDTKNERRRDNKNATDDEKTLAIFQTRDSLNIGVKLVVVYSIKDPELAVTRLGINGIVKHIETMATVDMTKAIKRCSSQDFTMFMQTKANADASSDPNAPQLHFQDMVKNELARDLLEYGIELQRLNIDQVKILNKEVREEMEAQAKRLAETNAKEAAIAQQTRITIAEAEQKAKSETISVNQKNAAILSQAQARLDAAKMEAEAVVIAARAEKDAKDLKGKLYEEHPKVLEVDLAAINAAAIAKAPMIMPGQMLPPGMFGNAFNMFGGQMRSDMSPNNNESTARHAPGK